MIGRSRRFWVTIHGLYRDQEGARLQALCRDTARGVPATRPAEGLRHGHTPATRHGWDACYTTRLGRLLHGTTGTPATRHDWYACDTAIVPTTRPAAAATRTRLCAQAGLSLVHCAPDSVFGLNTISESLFEHCSQQKKF